MTVSRKRPEYFHLRRKGATIRASGPPQVTLVVGPVLGGQGAANKQESDYQLGRAFQCATSRKSRDPSTWNSCLRTLPEL